jgi:DNA-binding NarL/FixJ family response regulator
MNRRAEPASPHAVLVVEDHAVMRQTLAQAIDRMDDFTVVADVSSGEDALTALASASVDGVIVDLSLPRMSGSDLVAELTQRSPHPWALVISGHRQPHYVDAARAAGARGYVLKGKPSEIPEALRAVAAGGTYVSQSLRLPGPGGAV